MPFMTYLARHDQPKQQTNKRSVLNSKKKEIGDYVLGKTIGRGASGRVKLGIHKQTGEKVAIKMISRSHLTASTSTAKSVQRELAVLQLLHHPHLIDLQQVLQDTQYVYFVMEYLEGGELFHVLAERGRLPEIEARHLFTQLITALTWCHQHHISHRDLKPENILLDKEKKNIKIADFGMAVMQPPHTLLKTSCGSPHYASPEIVRGKKYDGTATDVWSCGVILYAMVTGHLPFDDEHMGRLLAKIKTGRYRTLPDYLSTDAKDLIKRMLVVDPTKRMTMADILLHPWLTNKSFLGTELKFLQQPHLEFNSYPHLVQPMITHIHQLDGRIWETLKVLWRGKTDDEIVHCLSTTGFNVQKVTCKLLQERSIRLEQQQQIMQYENTSFVSLASSTQRPSAVTDDVLMTPPLRSSLRNGSEDIESYILPTPYASSIDTMSCCRTMELPPTPKSTTTFMDMQDLECKKRLVWDSRLMDQNMDSYSIMIQQQQQQNRSPISGGASILSTSTTARHWLHDSGLLSQTEETRGSKSDTADLFIMTKPVESTLISSFEPKRSAWQLCSKEPTPKLNWWDKTCNYLTKTKPASSWIQIESLSKHECETAGKLHQVLEECYDGKLSGRMYPHGRIVWSGTMKKDNKTMSFTCQMVKMMGLESKIKINFMPLDDLIHDFAELVDCLNKYETESDWVTETNGWIHPEMV